MHVIVGIMKFTFFNYVYSLLFQNSKLLHTNVFILSCQLMQNQPPTWVSN